MILDIFTSLLGATRKRTDNMIKTSSGQNVQTRIASLRLRHDRLEARIAAEMLCPHPNDLILQRLQTLRGRLKNETVALSGLLRTISRPPVATIPAYWGGEPNGVIAIQEA